MPKCDEIFDLLVKDRQIIVPRGLKDPSLKQKKKRGFCKFHIFLGHKTHQCVLFRDLVQKALKEGRIQFGERPKMQVDFDPLKVEEAMYAKPLEWLMVETTDGLIEVLKETSLDDSFEVMMVETTKGFGVKDERRPESAYPRLGESLSKFQEKCKEKGTKAPLCPKCSVVFDEKTAERLEADNKDEKEEKPNVT